MARPSVTWNCRSTASAFAICCCWALRCCCCWRHCDEDSPMRIALGVEYDGRPYCGRQSHPEGRTVQDPPQRALGQIADEPVAGLAAGRTGTGVPALEQVADFDTQAERPL